MPGLASGAFGVGVVGGSGVVSPVSGVESRLGAEMASDSAGPDECACDADSATMGEGNTDE